MLKGVCGNDMSEDNVECIGYIYLLIAVYKVILLGKEYTLAFWKSCPYYTSETTSTGKLCVEDNNKRTKISPCYPLK